ncbi:MAG: NAD(P)/FAD-dependent oxidoreductase [Aridibacter sp.]
MISQHRNKPQVVIIGGGFGGLEAAKRLAGKPVEVTLIDKKNHHTFQPLLYQVATAVLSAGEIASPIRRILQGNKNIEVVLGEAVGFDLETQTVELLYSDKVPYDYLIIAAGARHAYFGHDEWEDLAPGLKTVEDALEIRRRVLLAFEIAEHEAILTGTHEPLNFVVIGGGPTGVELAGAIAGIARQALAKDFQAIDTTKAKVKLFEGSKHVLGTYSEELSIKAEKQLEDLGVEVFTNSFVTDVEPGKIKVGEEWMKSSVTLWATGVAASPLGKSLNAETDKAGRVLVNKDLTVPNHENIFVIGDMVSLKQENGEPVPGVAPAAIQMAQNATANILRDLKGEPRKDFEYTDKGSMATIGRNKAIVEVGTWKFSGYFAWLMWLFVHVLTLIGFRNRLSVMSSWLWAYFTRNRSALLITGDAEQLSEVISYMRELPESVKPPQIEAKKSKEKSVN